MIEIELARNSFEQENKSVLVENEKKLKIFEGEEILKQNKEMENFITEINLKLEREKNVIMIC